MTVRKVSLLAIFSSHVQQSVKKTYKMTTRQQKNATDPLHFDIYRKHCKNGPNKVYWSALTAQTSQNHWCTMWLQHDDGGPEANSEQQ